MQYAGTLYSKASTTDGGDVECADDVRLDDTGMEGMGVEGMSDIEDMEFATPLMTPCRPTDHESLPSCYHSLLLPRGLSVSLVVISMVVLCYWSVRLISSTQDGPVALQWTYLMKSSDETNTTDTSIVLDAAPLFPLNGLYLPADWSPSTASAAPDSPPPNVRIVYRAHGWWFSGILEWCGQSLFRNFTVVEWDPLLENVWVIESFLGGEKPGPAAIDRSRGQRRIFVSGEPLDFVGLNDFDAIIDTKRVPFTRPAHIHAVYLPYYAAAIYEVAPATQLLKPSLYTGELAHNLTNRRFAAYMQGHCVSYRDHFFDRLVRYKQVDGLGRCKHNVAGSEEAAAAGSWQSSVKVYSNYKFVLCMENSMQQGYITEKILTVMLARAIPVYIGAPDIALHFDERSYIHVLSFASVDEAVELIAYLDSNNTAYIEMLSRPWMTDNRFNAWVTNNTQHNLFYQQLKHLRDVLMAPTYTYTDSNTVRVRTPDTANTTKD